MTTAAVRNLLAMPGPERRTGIEAMIVAEFRASLCMDPDEPLPMDTPYFELGLTSLRLVEARKRLEGLLGIPISSNVLFNRPTLAQLTAYLAERVLPGAAAAGSAAAGSAAAGSAAAGSAAAGDPPAGDPRAGVSPDPDEWALLDTVLPELNQAGTPKA